MLLNGLKFVLSWFGAHFSIAIYGMLLQGKKNSMLKSVICLDFESFILFQGLWNISELFNGLDLVLLWFVASFWHCNIFQEKKNSSYNCKISSLQAAAHVNNSGELQ